MSFLLFQSLQIRILFLFKSKFFFFLLPLRASDLLVRRSDRHSTGKDPIVQGRRVGGLCVTDGCVYTSVEICRA